MVPRNVMTQFEPGSKLFASTEAVEDIAMQRIGEGRFDVRCEDKIIDFFYDFRRRISSVIVRRADYCGDPKSASSFAKKLHDIGVRVSGMLNRVCVPDDLYQLQM